MNVRPSLGLISFYQKNGWTRQFLSSLLLEVIQIKSVILKAKTSRFNLSSPQKDLPYRITHSNIFTPGSTTLQTITCWGAGNGHNIDWRLTSSHLKTQFPQAAPTSNWIISFVVVQSLSCIQLFATPWTSACQASLSFTISWSLLQLMSIKSVMDWFHLVQPFFW